MSVDVGTNIVINDARKLENITGADGKYDNFQPNVTTLGGSEIDFNIPVMFKTLTANTTFTSTTTGMGRTSVLLLNTTASAYTPTFPSKMKWPAETVPSWSDHQYWLITFIAYDGFNVMSSAVGYDNFD